MPIETADKSTAYSNPKTVLLLWGILRSLSILWAAIVSALRPLTVIEQSVPLWPPSTPWAMWLQRVVLAPWERWDVVYYIRIALQGYRLDDGTAQFHPLYPWLALPLARVTNQPLLGLLIVSSLAGLGSAWLLFRLALLEWGETNAATAVLLYLFCPMAFVLFAPYSEALFLLLAIACFWFLRHRAWGLAGLMGGLAALTRQQGVLLLFPAAWELWEAHQRDFRTAARDWKACGALLLIPTGLLFWLVYRAYALGDMRPDATNVHALIYSLLISPSASKVVPLQTFQWPWFAFVGALRQFARSPNYRLFIDLFFGIGFVFALIGTWKHLRGSYRIFAASIVLVSFAYYTGPKFPYMGLPRHLFLAFPVFIGLGKMAFFRRMQLFWVGSGFIGSCFLILLYILEAWVP